MKLLSKYFIRALFTFITTLNLLSAIWIYVGRIDVQQGSWILALDLTFSHDLYDAITLFIIAEMYVVDTVTTVGYGEVVPKKTLEMAVTMCYEVVISFALKLKLCSFPESLSVPCFKQTLTIS